MIRRAPSIHIAGARTVGVAAGTTGSALAARGFAEASLASRRADCEGGVLLLQLRTITLRTMRFLCAAYDGFKTLAAVLTQIFKDGHRDSLMRRGSRDEYGILSL